MTLKISQLYLIEVEHQPVAIIPAENPLESIRKYLAKIGFNRDYRYFCNHLMTTSVTVDTKMDDIIKYHSATVDAITTSADILSISAQWVVSYDDIFAHINSKDIINNPLFVKPTIEEVRECVGFRDTPEFKLRKFCMKRR